MKKITLSPSTISIFLECPHCFWLHINERVKRPSGPFPSLPSGMDIILKNHFDGHRKDNSIPEELDGKIKGRLFNNLEKLNVWRDNFQGLRFTDEKTGVCLMGALDDLFITEDNKYAPIDFKTRGFPRKENTHTYYQHQMDIYSFLLEKNNLEPADFAILIFYHPIKVDDSHNVIFHPDPIKIPTDPAHGEKLFREALECLKNGKPEPSKDCEFCQWNRERETAQEEVQREEQEKTQESESERERKNNLSDFL